MADVGAQESSLGQASMLAQAQEEAICARASYLCDVVIMFIRFWGR